MTVAVLTLHFAGAGWTIQSADGKFKIDAEEACIDGKCKPTGPVTVDGRGMWFLASLDVDMRWASADTLELRTATSSWQPAALEVENKVEKLPATAVVEKITRWDRGILPGVWTLGTDGCQSGSTAWLYQPLVTEAPAWRVVGGKASEGGAVEACKGSEVPGIQAPKK